MRLNEMTVNDLNRLQQFRLERLLRFFTSNLPHCVIQADSSNTLTIECPTPAIVDGLLGELGDLLDHAWLILGTRAIALYFCQEEIFRSEASFCRQAVDKKTKTFIQ